MTDDGGASDGDTQSVGVGVGGGITLSASGYKVTGVHYADLSWNGATGADLDVYRDGAAVATPANDGDHTDSSGQKGHASYVYQVCDGTPTCSNTATVNF